MYNMYTFEHASTHLMKTDTKAIVKPKPIESDYYGLLKKKIEYFFLHNLDLFKLVLIAENSI